MTLSINGKTYDANELIAYHKELEKENAELKETVTKMNNVITETFRNLSKAKVVLRNVIDYLGQFCSDYPDCVIEAELFLKDSEVEK